VSSTPPRIVLFDLDGVLSHRDTMSHVVIRRFAQHPLRIPFGLPMLAASLLHDPTNDNRAKLNRRLVALALRGLQHTDYNAIADSAGDRLALAPHWPVLAAIARAGHHLELGDRVIATTASERRLARRYLDAVGLGAVELLASELKATFTGLAFVTHNYGVQKVVALDRARIDLADAILYTDSSSDLPLALRCRETVLVNASAATARRLSPLVPRLTRVRWR